MKKAFTLIELLVVVLIIGILAAIALPQYQKAVSKSQAATMLPSLRALALAQERYFLANGSYAARYADLDFSFDSLPLTTNVSPEHLTPASSDAVRANQTYKMVINGGVNPANNFLHSSSIFVQGPYKGAGLLIAHFVNNLNGIEPGQLYCFEYAIARDKFCRPFYGATRIGAANSVDYYKMP